MLLSPNFSSHMVDVELRTDSGRIFSLRMRFTKELFPAEVSPVNTNDQYKSYVMYIRFVSTVIMRISDGEGGGGGGGVCTKARHFANV